LVVDLFTKVEAMNREGKPPEPALMDPRGFTLRQPAGPDQLVDAITPENCLFMVTHLGIARLDVADWSLSIDGMVGRPRSWNFDELCRLPRKQVVSVHECAGSPVFPLIPQRRVGTVIWTGVPLAELLRASDVDPGATFVWLEGADHGSFAGHECPAYTKDLPIRKALEEDTLLAFEINGEPLPSDRGFPVRAVVPGFYGTNSVKWIKRITAATSRSTGLFTTRYYNDPPAVGESHVQPVWELAPNSIIVAPAANARVHPGPIQVWGWAWGHAPVVRVDVSTDGGTAWTEARVDERQAWRWQRFESEWQVPSVGEYQLLCRATDERGTTQPLTPRRNRSHLKTFFVEPPDRGPA